ncbi:MAG: HEPN domain-containing protein [Candidatus Melainabacteria bacterium]|nr:HEPN domain-containing protein [Candidatus Melainabacteria bacterium]
MKKETENWLKMARHDLKVADTLLKEGLYLGVIEHSHAALEKLIKGLIIEQNKKPLRIHSLLRLVSSTLIENVKEEVKDSLEELDDLYFSVRYPEDFDAVNAKLSPEKGNQVFGKIKEIYKLLERNIK